MKEFHKGTILTEPGAVSKRGGNETGMEGRID